jgi:hypothetical protein
MTATEAVADSRSRVLRLLDHPRLLTAAILLGGFFLLAFSFLIQDLGWFLWGAERALTDGKFYRDFVEMNAPMIMMLNTVPQSITRATGVSEVITYDAFIALMLVISLWLTRRIYHGVEISGAGPRWQWVLPTLLFGFVVVAPAIKSWGQREHITAMLVLPYLALALERAHGRLPSRAHIVAAALLCAVGIGIKPHFLLPLAAIEAFVGQHVGIRRALVRPELVIVGVSLTAYLIASMVVWPEYFRLMRDMGGAESYGAFLSGGLRAPSHFATSYSVMAILVSLAVPGRGGRQLLRRLLMWVVAGFLLSAFVQQKGFDYHFVPALVFATALFMMTLWETNSRHRLIRVAVALGMLVVFAKVGARALRTLRAVVTAPGSHVASTVDIVRTYAHGGTVLGVSLGLSPFVPAINYADAKWGSAFSTVWPLITAYDDQRTSHAPIRYHRPEEMGPLERYMFDRMIADMVQNPPDLIVFRRLLTDELYEDGRFNYLQYFSQDERFRRLFSQYRQLPIDEHYIWYARGELANRPFAPPRAPRFGTRWSRNCYNCLD